MKILPDESLPTKLSEFFGTEHEVLTVRDMTRDLYQLNSQTPGFIKKFGVSRCYLSIVNL